MPDLTDEEKARISAHRDELVNQEILRRLRTLAKKSEAEETQKIDAAGWVLAFLGILLIVAVIAKWAYSSF